MTKATRVVLIVGLLLVLLVGLFPPGQVRRFAPSRKGWGSGSEGRTYYTDRRVFLLSRHYRGHSKVVQYDRLMVEWGFIAAGTGVAFLVAYRRRP